MAAKLKTVTNHFRGGGDPAQAAKKPQPNEPHEKKKAKTRREEEEKGVLQGAKKPPPNEQHKKKKAKTRREEDAQGVLQAAKKPPPNDQHKKKRAKTRQEKEEQRLLLGEKIASQEPAKAKKGFRVRFFLPKRSGRKDAPPPQPWEAILSPFRPPPGAPAVSHHRSAAAAAAAAGSAHWAGYDYGASRGRGPGVLEAEEEGLSEAQLRLMRSPLGSFRGSDDEEDEEMEAHIGSLLRAPLIATPTNCSIGSRSENSAPLPFASSPLSSPSAISFQPSQGSHE
jgi:hypothetical protein